MEDSKSLSIESFSYTGLANRNASLISPNLSFRLSFDGASFIEMDPNLTPSKRFLVHQQFVAKPEPAMAHVHTDNIVSNSILVTSKSYSAGANIHVSSLGEEERLRKSRSMSLRKFKRLPKMIIQKYMDLVRPVWGRIRLGGSDSSQVQGLDRCGPVPKMSGVCWAGRCDSECSIHEAVVHCKKTFGMD